MLLAIITLLFSSLEPFLPWGSVLLAWSVALGAMKPGWGGLALVLLAGILRDVVRASALGISSAVFVVIWGLAALVHTRLDRPLLAAFLSGVIGSIGLGVVDGHITTGTFLINLLAIVIMVKVWETLLSRHAGIKLRDA